MYKTLFIALLFVSHILFGQDIAGLQIEVSVDKKLEDQWSTEGRLVVLFSKSGERPPLFQSTFASGRYAFARNVDEWDITNKKNLGAGQLISSADFGLNEIPVAEWHIQAVYCVADKPGLREAGNLYSEVIKTTIKNGQTINLSLSQLIEKRPSANVKDSKMVKYVSLKSELLSDFHGKEVNMEAAVLLPRNFDKSQKYPLRINIGGYGSSWTRATRLENNEEFMEWWLSGDAPEFIQLFLNGANGPYGDPYYLDSENNGPYGSALTQELIPYVEKEFKAYGSAQYRFVDGCSTGGWVSLALQIFYPDYFNGAWSFSADPVDFHHMQLINLYDDENAYYNKHGYLTPSVRDKNGQPRMSIRDEVAGENISSFTNSFTSSGGQWGGWNAVYSPKGNDGYPLAVFDPFSGKIDKQVVKHWEKFDLLKTLKDNWQDIGPKLQGKLWIWMGDMDQFYLNNAMREMDLFLKSTDHPRSDAIITFEATKGHCQEFDHRWILEMMQAKVSSLASEE